MVGLPGATPVTTPVKGSTVATNVLLLDHVPFEPLVLRLIVEPTQTVLGPLIVPGFGGGDTVTVKVHTLVLL